jgi:hypothetical protein
MYYFLLYGVFALWVLFDALNRKMHVSAVLWAVGTALLGPITLPVYLAWRPLKNGEVIEGGTAWNVLKNFAILWTIVMAIASIAGVIVMTKSATNATNDAEKVGAGLGIVVGMGLLAAVWFFPTIGAALLGFLLRKNTSIERGPTGPLVGRPSSASPAGGWTGLAGTAILGLIAIGLYGTRIATVANPTQGSPSAQKTVTPQPLVTSVSDGQWHLSQERSEMDGSRIVVLSLAAENEIQGWLSSKVPELNIRCREHKTDLYVVTGMAANVEYGTELHTVRIRLACDVRA